MLIRSRAKAAVLRLARTGPGRRLVQFVVEQSPELAIEPMGRRLNRGATFGSVVRWPTQADGFEDLDFLFASSTLNVGIVDMAIDEAAYLFRLVRGLSAARLAEIGRFKGGSAFLIAVAMDERSELYSYDIHVKLTDVYEGRQLDGELADALVRFGLADRVHVLVADSRTVEPPGECDLVLVDGDHTYEGVRADYEHWRRFVRPGGHLVFHDAAAERPLASRHEDVARLVGEIEARDGRQLQRMPAAGSLAHFVRTDAPW